MSFFKTPMTYFILLTVFISSSKQENLDKSKKPSKFFFLFCRKDSSLRHNFFKNKVHIIFHIQDFSICGRFWK